jgi:hypothetical protein
MIRCVKSQTRRSAMATACHGGRQQRARKNAPTTLREQAPCHYVGAADLTEDGEIKVASFSSPDPLWPEIPNRSDRARRRYRSLDSKNPNGLCVSVRQPPWDSVVSGVAACLYAMRPDLTPAQVKQILSRMPTAEKEDVMPKAAVS